MFVLIPRIVQYSLLLSISLLFVWILTIEIIYQNKICSLIEINKLNSKNENISLIIDERLKLNHFSIIGTHNSYHRSNIYYKYEHQSLEKQFDIGIRQIELDIHIMKNNLVVYHLQLIDDKTNCYCFKECLMKIFNWTNKHRFHFPIYLFIEIKQMFYEDIMTGLTGGIKCRHLQQIKDQILEIFSLNTFITANHIQGNQSSIKIALKQQKQDELSGDYSYKNSGWPSLYQSLGKLIPVFLDDVHNRAIHLYSICKPLQTFFLIAQKNSNLPYSSIICFSNLIINTNDLINIAINGQIIRLLIGSGNNNTHFKYQTTKPYGIHIISTDSEHCNNTILCQDFKKDFTNSTILCNHYSAPTFCHLSSKSIFYL